MDDQPWSDEVEGCLKEQFRGEYIKWLPLLWEQRFSARYKARVRTVFMNAVTNAVRRDFSVQIGSWCREHGVAYIGHLIEDNGQHTRTASSLGHYFRGLTGQDMAGIDDIGEQVLPQGEWNGNYGAMGNYRSGEFYHFVLGKLAASLAAIDPLKKGDAMCEIFGAYGWSEGVRLEKYLVDHFMVRGINHFVPHAFSPKAFPDPDCPPHFYAHGHNPQYRHFGELMRYTDRVCGMISGGRRVARTAVLYYAEAEWAGEYMELEKPAAILTRMQVDFDLIPADVFAERAYYKTRIGRQLQVNGQAYDLVFVPYMQFVPQTAVEALEELRDAGCCVCFIDAFPDGTCEGELLLEEKWKGYADIALRQMETFVREYLPVPVRLQPADQNIRVLEYRKDYTLYMLVNEGTEVYAGDILLPVHSDCLLYDAWFHRYEKISGSQEAAVRRFTVRLQPLHSCFLLFDRKVADGMDGILSGAEFIEKADLSNRKSRPVSGQWERSLCRSVEYPESFGAAVTVTVPDKLEQEQPAFSGIVAYERAFRREELGRNPVITVTDAYEGVELFVNGVSLGIQIVPPFRYELGSCILPGVNRIRIEVATTLERQMADWSDEGKKPTCPSGINGEILLESDTDVL